MYLCIISLLFVTVCYTRFVRSTSKNCLHSLRRLSLCTHQTWLLLVPKSPSLPHSLFTASLPYPTRPFTPLLSSHSISDIVFSTAHKSKGLEFDTVKLTDDYSIYEDEDRHGTQHHPSKLDTFSTYVYSINLGRAHQHIMLVPYTWICFCQHQSNGSDVLPAPANIHTYFSCLLHVSHEVSKKSVHC